MLMNDTNFLRTAIISEKFFEGISLRMASTESWRERESRVRLREGKEEGWNKNRKEWEAVVHKTFRTKLLVETYRKIETKTPATRSI